MGSQGGSHGQRDISFFKRHGLQAVVFTTAGATTVIIRQDGTVAILAILKLGSAPYPACGWEPPAIEIQTFGSPGVAVQISLNPFDTSFHGAACGSKGGASVAFAVGREGSSRNSGRMGEPVLSLR